MYSKLLIGSIIILFLVILGEVTYLFVIKPNLVKNTSAPNSSQTDIENKTPEEEQQADTPAGGAYGQYSDFSINMTGQEFASEARTIVSFEGVVQALETTTYGTNLEIKTAKNSENIILFFRPQDLNKILVEKQEGEIRSKGLLQEIKKDDAIKVTLDMDLLNASDSVSVYRSILILILK